jgi:hypothetical protein
MKVKEIKGFITDKEVFGDYIVFDVFGYLGFWYSSDIHNGTDVKVYLEEKLSFDDVYSNFMKYRFWGLKFNKKQDICLSLFYNPYFTEFYERVKKDILMISKNRLRFIKCFLLKYLADSTYLQDAVENGMVSELTKNYCIEKDIFNRSKELLSLIAINRS